MELWYNYHTVNSKPIGVFDSGIGGLTVVKEIIRVLPHEKIIYLGDTARVPYGTRGRDVITKFASELAHFLLKQGVKFLVVACNTISATCLKEIEKLSPVPVIGVIKPAVDEAIRKTRNHKIGVIATRATVSSGVYEREIKKLDKQAQVVMQACPLFVPLAEEGSINHQVAKLIAEEYLLVYKKTPVDTLILGCTHYPLLSNIIQKTAGEGVTLVDSARPTANALKALLKDKKLLSEGQKITHRFFVTDAPERLTQTVTFFFDHHLPGKLEKVTLGT